MRSTRHTTWPKIPSLLFCLWGKCDYRSQAVGSSIQERCHKPVIQASNNNAKNTTIQHMSIIQAWGKGIHCWLAIQKQPWDRDEEVQGMFITINPIVLNRHISLHDSRKNKNTNVRWWAHKDAIRTHTIGWPSSRAGVQKEMQSYWLFRDEIAYLALEWKAEE